MASYRDYNTSETKLVSVRLRTDVFERIDELAEARGRSRSAIVNALLAKTLDLEKSDRISDRISELEREIANLSSEVASLRSEVRSISATASAIDIDII